MKNSLHVEKGNPYPLGATMINDGINFSLECNPVLECSLILYPKEEAVEIKIDLTEEYRMGNIFSVSIQPLCMNDYDYNYEIDGKIIPDIYGKKIIGKEKYANTGEALKTAFVSDEYNWDGDKSPQIAYEDSIFYCLHVRGFTKHSSSKVIHKGTFTGITEKTDYLKELGITAVVLMPCYEFEETQMKNSAEHIYYSANMNAKNQAETDKLINYWGYKKGYYLAPKSSYASKPMFADLEFKDMVKQLHNENIEVIMQFYFPKEISQSYLIDVLRDWKRLYHVDGFVLMGEKIPQELISSEPLLKRTKLIFNEAIVFPQQPFRIEDRNTALSQDDFMITTRRFLKSDEDMVSKFLELSRSNPAQYAMIKYITNYYGFTLYDLVTYDQKHNEANGEENRDGNSYNYSWNCGVEGPSRKQSVKNLRLKQMKNALIFLLLSQGTPMIMSGDEFGNSQEGNNNPYCQDNEISWLDWSDLKRNKEIFEFMKSMISLRKEHLIFRRKEEFRIMDTLSCGFPDISYHGEEVWRAETQNHSRYIAIMYCGLYARTNRQDDNFFYLAINMHWIPHTFALPRLPEGKVWEEIVNTDISIKTPDKKELSEKQELKVDVTSRSIRIFMSREILNNQIIKSDKKTINKKDTIDKLSSNRKKKG